MLQPGAYNANKTSSQVGKQIQETVNTVMISTNAQAK